MNRILLLATLAVTVVLMSGCFTLTRTESDLYRITQRDTTIREDVRNAPGERDNGTVYPSPRTVDIDRRYLQRDSTVKRYYPAYLRAGGIETAGFIAPGTSSQGTGNGLFGLYRFLTFQNPQGSKIFGSYMYRLMPYEVRLRIFDDEPNWTLGTAAYESFTFQNDSLSGISPGESLDGLLPIYVRKRFFLREDPPYVMVVPFFGVAFFPSVYVNLGATFDVGSYGGFNIRAYAGYITGTDWVSAQNDRRNRDFSASYPYFGVGVSALDFVNTTPELFIEWKDHKHNAIEVSAASIDVVYSTSQDSGSFFSNINSNGVNLPTTKSAFPSGFMFRLASANIPLNFADGNFFLGTTLFNGMLLSKTEVGFGFLPIRVGYRKPLLGDDLNAQAYLEYTYFPSTLFNVGTRVSLKIYDWVTMDVVAGYVNGSTNVDVITDIPELAAFKSFSTFYFGVGINGGHIFNSLETVRRPIGPR